MSKSRRRKRMSSSVSARAKILSGGRSTRKRGIGIGMDAPLIPSSSVSSVSSHHRRTKKVRAFTKKDFHSGDGMLTTVWGPSMWHFLHTMSFNYPVTPTQEQKRHYILGGTRLCYRNLLYW